MRFALELPTTRVDAPDATAVGRTEPFDVCFAPLVLTTLGDGDQGAVRDEIAALGELGVTHRSPRRPRHAPNG